MKFPIAYLIWQMSAVVTAERIESGSDSYIIPQEFNAVFAGYEKNYLPLEIARSRRIETLTEPEFKDRPFPFEKMHRFDAEFVPYLSPGEAKQLTLSLSEVFRSQNDLAIKSYWAVLIRTQGGNGVDSYEMLTAHPDRLEEGNDPFAYSGLGLDHDNSRQTQISRVKDGAIYPREVEDPALYGKESRGLVIETSDPNLKFAIWGREAVKKLDSLGCNLTLEEFRALGLPIPLDPQLLQDFDRRYSLVTLANTSTDTFLKDLIAQNQIGKAILRRSNKQGIQSDVFSFLREKCLIRSRISPD